MQLQRVVGVRGLSGPGTGYVLDGRVVLTSAHVVGDLESTVRVFLPGRAGEHQGVVVWRGTPGGRDDAALVVVEDPSWVLPAGAAVRWGRTVTHQPGIKCVMA